MAHFTVYDTDVTKTAGAVGDQNFGSNPFPAIPAKGEITLLPTQTDFAEYITGIVESDKEGELIIEVSFDFPQHYYGTLEEALENSHWVPLEQNLNNETGGKIVVKAKESKSFTLFAIAPYFRLTWKDKSEEENEHLRIFARAQEKGRV